jgi:hypothetical protein
MACRNWLVALAVLAVLVVALMVFTGCQQRQLTDENRVREAQDLLTVGRGTVAPDHADRHPCVLTRTGFVGYGSSASGPCNCTWWCSF